MEEEEKEEEEEEEEEEEGATCTPLSFVIDHLFDRVL
jgi:hypothetical protein